MRATSIAMTALMFAIFTVMTGIALLSYPEGARFQPLVIGLPAIGLCLLQLALDLRSSNVETAPSAAPNAPPPVARELSAWAWLLGLVGGVLLAGFWISIPLFLVAYLRIEARTSWLLALGLGTGATAVLHAFFGLLLKSSLHEGFLLQWLKG